MRNALQSTNRCTSRLPEGQLSANTRPTVFEIVRRSSVRYIAISRFSLDLTPLLIKMTVKYNGGG